MEVLRYPGWRYHRSGRAIIVNSPEQDVEQASGPDWADTPAAFPPVAISDDPEKTKLQQELYALRAELANIAKRDNEAALARQAVVVQEAQANAASNDPAMGGKLATAAPPPKK